MKLKPAKYAVFIFPIIWVMGTAYAAADDKENAAPTWKRWKSIDAAIALRPLDGPDDIVEKAEIIEDRVDELAREKKRLEKITLESRKNLKILLDQRDVLRNVMEIQLGSDSTARQRMRDLNERIRKKEALLKKETKSIAELQAALNRYKELAVEYRKKAEKLRIEEGGAK